MGDMGVLVGLMLLNEGRAIRRLGELAAEPWKDPEASAQHRRRARKEVGGGLLRSRLTGGLLVGR